MQINPASSESAINLCRNNLSVSDDEMQSGASPRRQFLNFWRANFFRLMHRKFCGSAASFTAKKETSGRALGAGPAA